MKKLSSVSLVLFVLVSCKKLPITPPIPPETTSKVITSVTVYDSSRHRSQVDSFEYDGNNRLKNFYQLAFDSSQVPAYAGVSKNVMNYSGDDSLPVSITNGSDLHILEYNDLKQIVKDSVTNLYTYYFNYGTNLLYTTLVLPPAIGTYKDTIVLQNGNMVSSEYWFFMPNNTQHSSTVRTYTSDNNPLHNLKNMGVLLYALGGRNLDYVSTNLVATLSANGTVSEINTWVSSGAYVTNGTESFGSDHVLVSFRYK